MAQLKRDELIEAADAAGPDARRPYEELSSEVQQEIDEYCGIRDGHIRDFSISDLADIAAGLVKARIARNWTQKQLADALGVTEQMVQRDEAGGYKRAGLARLAEVADVLNYRVAGCLLPSDSGMWPLSVAADPTSVAQRTRERFSTSPSSRLNPAYVRDCSVIVPSSRSYNLWGIQSAWAPFSGFLVDDAEFSCDGSMTFLEVTGTTPILDSSETPAREGAA